MASFEGAEFAGQTPIAPVGSVAMRSLTPELQEMIGGGGGLPSFQGGGHTSGAETVNEPFLSPNDPSMPRGTLVVRGMVSANREDGFETGGFVFDAAVCVRDGQAPYVIGIPSIVPFLGAITPGIGFALAIEDDNLCGAFTGVGGTEIDWTISGTWTGNFGGAGDGGGGK